MLRALGSSKRRVAEEEEEYEVDVGHDRITSSRGSRLALFGSDFRLGRRRPLTDGFFNCLVIHPDNRYVTKQHPLLPLPPPLVF
jgi:potassium channel